MPTPCALPAGWGTNHRGVGRCRKHGGNTRSHVSRAQRIQAERARDTYGLPINVPADVALLQELARTAGHVAWLFERVRETDPQALVWGTVEELEKGASEFPGVDVKKAAGPNAYLELYIRERRHLLDVAKAIAGLGLEERRVGLIERQGDAMAAVFGRVLQRLVDGLGSLPWLSVDQRAELVAVAGAMVPVLLAEEVGPLAGPQVIEGSAR